MEMCYRIGRGKFQPFHLEQSDEAIAATHAEHAKQVCGQNRGICPKPPASLVNNQDISNISSWNVSSVTNMWYMFFSATSFNSDISNWDVSSVTNVRYMFANSGFNSDISSWNVSSVSNTWRPCLWARLPSTLTLVIGISHPSTQ